MVEKCGFVAIVGLPNAGKSTLVNLFVGQKISIVSRKVQTTRVKTLGIANHTDLHNNECQLILLDTPGLFEAKSDLEKVLVDNAMSSLKEADILVLLVDASSKDFRDSVSIFKKIAQKKITFLVFNKMDKVTEAKKNDLLDAFKDINVLKTHFISAQKGDGVENLLNELSAFLPFHPWLYPEDMITTQPEAVWAAEITREQVFRQLHEELPYQIFVEPESFERFQNGDLKISQAIVVARDGQKGIVLGHKGARIKEIGQKARLELEAQMDCRVHLKLFVKVRENWMENKSFLKLISSH